MKTKRTQYFVVLYRPVGSRTWTPFRCDRASGNFFAAKASAEQWVIELAKIGCSSYIPATGGIVGTEFKIGRVTVEGDPKEPFIVAEPNKVGLS